MMRSKFVEETRLHASMIRVADAEAKKVRALCMAVKLTAGKLCLVSSRRLENELIQQKVTE